MQAQVRPQQPPWDNEGRWLSKAALMLATLSLCALASKTSAVRPRFVADKLLEQHASRFVVQMGRPVKGKKGYCMLVTVCIAWMCYPVCGWPIASLLLLDSDKLSITKVASRYYHMRVTSSFLKSSLLQSLSTAVTWSTPDPLCTGCAHHFFCLQLAYIKDPQTT